ncbi:MAG: hypothetical protein HDQ88_00955 [Clostridia bacterium]|nr:hypothetical protein [Clostridia bacterium]
MAEKRGLQFVNLRKNTRPIDWSKVFENDSNALFACPDPEEDEESFLRRELALIRDIESGKTVLRSWHMGMSFDEYKASVLKRLEKYESI